MAMIEPYGGATAGGPSFSGPDREGAGRIRRLTQAALNADLTIGRVEGVLGEIGSSLDYFRNVLGTFDGALDRFGNTLDSLVTSIEGIDDVVDSLTGTQQSLDGLVADFGEIIATVNWLLTPVSIARTQLARVAALPGAGAVNEALGVLTGRGR